MILKIKFLSHYNCPKQVEQQNINVFKFLYLYERQERQNVLINQKRYYDKNKWKELILIIDMIDKTLVSFKTLIRNFFERHIQL